VVLFPGRQLFLTEDAGLVRRQLAGEDLAWDANDPALKLRDDISTDEITPGWTCFHHDAALGRFAYLGLTCRDGETRVQPVGEDAVRRLLGVRGGEAPGKGLFP
jgi:3-isopropylmalate/(R)-2-methylmalate dehydratase large subunit